MENGVPPAPEHPKGAQEWTIENGEWTMDNGQ